MKLDTMEVKSCNDSRPSVNITITAQHPCHTCCCYNTLTFLSPLSEKIPSVKLANHEVNDCALQDSGHAAGARRLTLK